MHRDGEIGEHASFRLTTLLLFCLVGRAELLLGQFERRYQAEEDRSDQQQGVSPRAQEPFSSWRVTLPQPPWNQQARQSADTQQQVATKLAPYPWRLTRGSLVKAATESLRRLDQPKLAIAQLHWSTSKYLPQQEFALWEGIGDVYDNGLCEAVGVSNYGPRQLLRVAEYFRTRNVPLAVAQIQYSLMTYGEARLMNDACEETGCRLISYSPLCLGLLTGKYDLDNLPKAGLRRQLFRELLPGAQGLLGVLKAVAKEYGKTPSQVAINWAARKGTVPIPGCRTVRHAQENVGSVLQWKLKPDAVLELDTAALAVKKPMIQNVFQTR
jgi:pyridoxine 4-dehydrogenase